MSQEAMPRFGKRTCMHILIYGIFIFTTIMFFKIMTNPIDDFQEKLKNNLKYMPECQNLIDEEDAELCVKKIVHLELQEVVDNLLEKLKHQFNPMFHITLENYIRIAFKDIFDEFANRNSDIAKRKMSPISNVSMIVNRSDASDRKNKMVAPANKANEMQNTGPKRKRKRILFWTKFFGVKDFWFGLGREPFINHNCSIIECETTTDKKLLNKSDAVLVHMRDIDGPENLPRHRFPNQNWVFFLMEPPQNLWLELDKFNGMFNLTMTYRLDSDIQQVYGRVRPLTQNEEDTIPLMLPTNFAEGRKKKVAWFVSNCEAPSKRLEYAHELQKLIQVDIYGKCGKYSCRDINGCYEMLGREYKFYLAFENNICKDYVTEKLFAAMKLDVLPIVLGGFEYTKHLPPHSYIDVADFESPEKLAKYLHYLDKNDAEYNKYFEWKKKFTVVWPFHMYSFCDLCIYLHQKEHVRDKTYNRLEEWWNIDTDCMDMDTYYRGVADVLRT